MDIILMPFAWVIQQFYNLFQNYALAIFLFALVIKVVLFPFSLKGKKGMIQTTMLQGQLQRLQKMYGNNKERYNLEVQKLYEKEKVNPMGGCLWTFIPLIFLMILYPIIREPIHYMMGISDPDTLNAIAQAVNWDTVAVANGWIKEAAATFTETSGYYNQLYLASLITPDNLAAVQAAVGEAGSSIFAINFDLFGLIDLSQIPTLKFWTVPGGFGLFLLPVISAALSLVMSLVSQKTNSFSRQNDQTNNSTMKTMLVIGPLMSLWIGFALPAALCIYWIANSLFSMVQEYLCAILLRKDYAEAQAKREERERQEKEDEKRRKEEARQERIRRIEESKQAAKGKKKTQPKKKESGESGVNKEASRVGIRAYARGRAYDPYRFSPDGPTPYLSDTAVDDAAVEKALEEQAEKREKAEFAEKYGLTEEEALEVEKAAQEEATAAVEETAADGESETTEEETEEL